jgi:hypothetical protein
MPALNRKRGTSREVVTHISIPMAANAVFYAGASAAINAAGFAEPMTAAAAKKSVGKVMADITNGAVAGARSVLVELSQPRTCFLWNNGGGGDAISAFDIGKLAYGLDDNSVSIVPTAKSPVGTIMGIASDGQVKVFHDQF